MCVRPSKSVSVSDADPELSKCFFFSPFAFRDSAIDLPTAKLQRLTNRHTGQMQLFFSGPRLDFSML